MIKNLLAVLVSAFLAVSCQEDTVTEKTVALTSSSELTDMIKSMTVNETAIDNILDNTSCFKVQLPVEVTVNGRAMLVSTSSDYNVVQGILNESETDEDIVEFGYPITLERPDYSTFSISDKNQFNAAVAQCSGTPDYIGTACVSIAYPITAFTYNSGFQMQNNFVVADNAGLYGILKNMAVNEYYALRYPVSLMVKDGPNITIGNNEQFYSAVSNALIGCKQGGCTNPGVLVNNLLLYVPFSNSTISDLKGGTINATDGVNFTSDRDGNQNCSVLFSGSEYLQIPASTGNTIGASDAFSVSLWFKMNNTNSNNHERLLAKGENGAGFEISLFSLNAPQFKAGGLVLVDNDWKNDAALPVDITKWHHLVVTVDADNIVSLYRDGQLRNTMQPAESIGTAAMDYYIGNNFQGFLDDLRVYKRALLPQEIQTLYELDGDCNTCLE